MSTRWTRARLLLSGLGLLISAYLTAVHYTKVPLACPATGIIDCAQVLHSPESMVLGLPLGVWGMVWFIVMGILSARAGRVAAAGGDAVLPRRVWGAVGAASVVYFLYLELLVIGKVCIFCTGVHLVVLALFVMEAVGLE